jgi:hypothetical protein
LRALQSTSALTYSFVSSEVDKPSSALSHLESLLS